MPRMLFLVQILAAKKVFLRVLDSRLRRCKHKLYFTIGIYMNNRNCVSTKVVFFVGRAERERSAPNTILQVK
jgi:hypothetical protein